MLAGTVVVAIGLLSGAAAAKISSCVVSAGVMQTPDVVTGPAVLTQSRAAARTRPRQSMALGSGDTITGTDFPDKINAALETTRGAA
ncbi:MAG: hypothetical protein QOD83_359 [Solirubrobacteraceae bacterium]|nr:hypothetical protein [Solirubrobacteraceae bacterium]